MNLDDVIINPLVDFSVDFVGDFDPNCLAKEDVEKMLQSGINLQDHQSINSYYEKVNDKHDVTENSSRRFATVNVESQIDNAQTTSVKRRNVWVKNIFNTWCEEKVKAGEIDSHLQQLEHFNNDEINDYLSKFILEVRKQDGTFYPRESLLSIAAGLQSIVRKEHPEINLFNSYKTKRFTDAMDASMKMSTSSLPPKNCTKHKPISIFDEEEIVKSEILGGDTPERLTRTLFYLNGINFALRGGEEQTKLTINQFQIDSRNGVKCLIYSPITGKTCNGGLKDRRKSANERCYFHNENDKLKHVELFEKFLSVRPPNVDRFYLYPSKHWKTTSYWYTSRPLGKNVTSKMTRLICNEAGIKERTNHSLRATCATRMFEGKVDEQIIMERTGHTSVMGVRTYKRTSDVLIKDSQLSLHHSQVTVSSQPACSSKSIDRDSNSKQFKFGNLYFSNCKVTNNFYGGGEPNCN